jgi:hypothetical protein
LQRGSVGAYSECSSRHGGPLLINGKATYESQLGIFEAASISGLTRCWSCHCFTNLSAA